jgi:type III secretory pathway component EscR
MPLRLVKLALKAKDLPEARILGRVALGFTGLFVMAPVASALMRPAELAVTDWVGLLVFTTVGGWLIVLAVRGGGEPE